MKILKRTVSHNGRREAARWVPRRGKRRRGENHRMRKALIRQRKSGGRS
nr:MAG TPA: hypothetical protein [Phage sp. ctucZ11]